jgi:hypothetical protein
MGPVDIRDMILLVLFDLKVVGVPSFKEQFGELAKFFVTEVAEFFLMQLANWFPQLPEQVGGFVCDDHLDNTSVGFTSLTLHKPLFDKAINQPGDIWIASDQVLANRLAGDALATSCCNNPQHVVGGLGQAVFGKQLTKVAAQHVQRAFQIQVNFFMGQRERMNLAQLLLKVLRSRLGAGVL